MATSHADHDHPNTASARAKCRRDGPGSTSTSKSKPEASPRPKQRSRLDETTGDRRLRETLHHETITAAEIMHITAGDPSCPHEQVTRKFFTSQATGEKVRKYRYVCENDECHKVSASPFGSALWLADLHEGNKRAAQRDSV